MFMNFHFIYSFTFDFKSQFWTQIGANNLRMYIYESISEYLQALLLRLEDM